jgi:formate dehydrogenase major subunit
VPRLERRRRCWRASARAPVSTTYGDIINADVAILAGTNTTANHPVAVLVLQAGAAARTKLIVVDPRRERIADHADIFCQIKPGTDVAFYNGVLHEDHPARARRPGVHRRARDRYGELAKLVREYPPERAAAICGVDADTIREGGAAVGRGRRGGHLLGGWASPSTRPARTTRAA